MQVAPGANLQALIDAKPKRTTFCFAQGLYRLSGTIDTGDKFPTLDLRAGAVIDGQNGGFMGIGGPDGPADQPGTVILGGVFQHFGNASSPSWVQPMIVRRNGVVDGTEFRDNFNSGLTVQGDNARVVHVYTHHNATVAPPALIPPSRSFSTTTVDHGQCRRRLRRSRRGDVEMTTAPSLRTRTSASLSHAARSS